MGKYVITGIKAGITPDTVPLRLEVDSWYPGQTKEHLLQNSLFIWALRFLEDKDPKEKLSYFQIAGIHGSPYEPWDENTESQTPDEGYCTHDSILFPCWHRPYMLLFEQVLYEVMENEVIKKLPENMRKVWRDAAATFRLPYWDWAEKKKRGDAVVYDVPIIAKAPEIEVINLNDGTTTVKIDNPMYKFTMPGGAAMGSYNVGDVDDQTSEGKKISIPFSKSKSTSRWAPFESESPNVSTEWINGEVNNEMAAEALNDHKWYNGENLPLAEMTYRLFLPQYITSFSQFATTKYSETNEAASYLNLEFVHNNVHNWTGGTDKYIGHMTEVPVAAFDPIFFMHHCNVDRQFAIWQALNVDNKDNWFERQDEQLVDNGTWSIEKGSTDTPKTPLTPFHKDTEGTYFTSDDIRDWTQWGYSYPELQPWLPKYKPEGKFDKQLYLNDIQNQLKKLYSSPEVEDAPADIIVNVEYKRFALDGIPYTVYFFIGDEDKINQYKEPLYTHPSLVGYVYTFTNPVYQNPDAPGCGHCRAKSAEGTTSTAQIPITAALLPRVSSSQDVASTTSSHSLPSITDPENVSQHLEKNLHWRVKVHGHDVSIPNDDPFVKVSVYHRKVDPSHRSRGHGYSHLKHATRGKAGGFWA
ncbi:Di-copper centre-containing protein [Daldinia vernicosa]|uniref:Di-copper centre-containing protein n=1 Tax=Daldinia vernicosa TaxID=114800 RepID=UPI002007C08D|nr:Di-copper centre-containing protein [Daldinia vernicosa]KAI0854170.1 Di-copper centre-containing protein [Daldinia vernicosa]